MNKVMQENVSNKVKNIAENVKNMGTQPGNSSYGDNERDYIKSKITLWLDNMYEVELLSDDSSNAIFDALESVQGDEALNTLYNDICKLHTYCMDSKTYINNSLNKIVSMYGNTNEIYYAPSIRDSERNRIISDISNRVNHMLDGNSLTRNDAEKIDNAFLNIKNDIALMQFHENIKEIHELHLMINDISESEYRKSIPKENDILKEETQEKNINEKLSYIENLMKNGVQTQINKSITINKNSIHENKQGKEKKEDMNEEIKKLDASIYDFKKAMEAAGIPHNQQTKVLNNIMELKIEMEKDYGLGDKLFENIGNVKDKIRNDLNEIGYFVRDTKIQIIGYVQSFKNMINNSKEKLTQIGRVALNEFSLKFAGLKERYHNFMNERDKVAIEKNNKAIDGIISRSEYNSRVAYAMQSLGLTLRGEIKMPEYKHTISNRNQSRIDKLTADTQARLERRAERQSEDILSKLNRIENTQVQHSLFAMQLTEIAKAAEKDIVAGYVDGNNIVSEKDAPDVIKKKNDKIIISTDLNKNQNLYEYQNTNLLKNALIAYEIAMEQDYREERSQEIETNVDNYFNDLTEEQIKSLAEQIEQNQINIRESYEMYDKMDVEEECDFEDLEEEDFVFD